MWPILHSTRPPGYDRRCLRALAALAVLAAFGGPVGAAHANVVVYGTVLGPGGDPDIARIDTTTGAITRLGASVNTGAREAGSALSPDGLLLAYERGPRDRAAIMVTNLSTGATASVVDAFDVQALHPAQPAWTASSHLLLGVAAAPQNGVLMDRLLDVDLTNLPNGPFPRTTRILGPAGPDDFLTNSPAEAQVPGVAAPVDVAIGRGLSSHGAVVGQHTTAPATVPEGDSAHPTISSAVGVVVFMFAPSGTSPSRLQFTDLGATASLPAIVNAPGADEQLPQFSPDGRYLAFIRAAAGERRLFVWDTSSQLLLNSTGVKLDPPVSAAGASTPFEQRALDGLSVRVEQSVFASALIASRGLIVIRTVLPSRVGIIVQKVVGRTKVLGRNAVKLRYVGRVPLGSFHAGRSTIHWDLHVAGRRLAAGRYQVTPRSLTAKGGIRDLGKPVVITIPSHEAR